MSRKIIGYVRIISVPTGNAPLKVRMGWLGLLLPSYGQIENDNISHLLDSKELAPNRKWPFVVPQKEAIEILEKNNSEAAAWFREHGYPRENGAFTFGENEVYFEDIIQVEA
jgi:hypothetical protein